uniref:Uncharacterized protein n=1 Tax=Ciona savignyi TaxID=51511 RepID=H2YLH0_CIOSA
MGASPEHSRPKKRKKKDEKRSRLRSRSGSGGRRKRSRSRDKSSRHASTKSSRRSSSRSPHRRRSTSRERTKRKRRHENAVLGLATGTMKDVMDIVPGFSQMNPAEQSRIRVQRALKVAVESSTPDLEEKNSPEERLSVLEQIDRARLIEAISDDDDLPTQHKPKLFTERESNHESAIFGHMTMLSHKEAMEIKQQSDEKALLKAKQKVDFYNRDPKSLMGPKLLLNADEVSARWINKLKSIRETIMMSQP